MSFKDIFHTTIVKTMTKIKEKIDGDPVIEVADRVYGIRTCSSDLTSSRSFQWKEGWNEAKDWKPKAECGNGLHFIANGIGDAQLMNWSDDAKWLVVYAEKSGVIDIDKKVKARKVFCEKIFDKPGEAFDYLYKIVGVMDGQIMGSSNQTGDRGSSNQTGYRGSSNQTGDRGSSNQTGDRGSSNQTGYRGSSNQTGDMGSSNQTGDRGSSNQTGYMGSSNQTGYMGSSNQTGYMGSSNQTGDRGSSNQTGYRGSSNQTGDMGSSNQTGYMGSSNQTGYRGSSNQTGDRGSSNQTGYRGSSNQTGYMGSSNQTGYRGSSNQTGDRGSSNQTGYMGSSNQTGDMGSSNQTGDMGSSNQTGYMGSSNQTGDMGSSNQTGDMGSSNQTGYRGRSAARGTHGHATAHGKEARVLAGENGIIQLKYYDGARYRLVTGYAGEGDIKPFEWYALDSSNNFKQVVFDYSNTGITPEEITEVKGNEVFVFGSNLLGQHIGGAARLALEKFGALTGYPVGLCGNSYALPTVSVEMKPLSLSIIQGYIIAFLQQATWDSGYTFLVTKIGCGIAGYKDEEIAELFYGYEIPRNVRLPQSFVNHLIARSK